VWTVEHTDPAVLLLAGSTVDQPARADQSDTWRSFTFRQRGEPARSDRLLAVLARRAPDDEIAARLLLHLLLPGAKALAGRVWWLGSAEERAAAVVGARFERIRTYPFQRRPRRIAANVLADAHGWLWRNRPGRFAVEVPVAEITSDQLGRPGAPGPSEELLDLLAWAMHAGVLSADEVRLIGQDDKGTRPPGRREHLADGLAPSTSGRTEHHGHPQ